MRKRFSEKDYISIHNNSKYGIFIVDSHSQMFKNKSLLVSVDEESITFTTPDIDFTGKSLTPSNRDSTKDGLRGVTVSQVELPLGRFLADEEESNEDKLVVYFNQ